MQRRTLLFVGILIISFLFNIIVLLYSFPKEAKPTEKIVYIEKQVPVAAPAPPPKVVIIDKDKEREAKEERFIERLKIIEADDKDNIPANVPPFKIGDMRDRTANTCTEKDWETGFVVYSLFFQLEDGQHPYMTDLLLGQRKTSVPKMQKHIVFFWLNYNRNIEIRLPTIFYHNNLFDAEFLKRVEHPCIKFKNVTEWHEKFMTPSGRLYGSSLRYLALQNAMENVVPNSKFVYHIDLDSFCFYNPVYWMQHQWPKQRKFVFTSLVDDLRKSKEDIRSEYKYMQEKHSDRCFGKDKYDIYKIDPTLLVSQNPMGGKFKYMKPFVDRIVDIYVNEVSDKRYSCDMILHTVQLNRTKALFDNEDDIYFSWQYGQVDEYETPCVHLKGVDQLLNTCYPKFFNEKQFPYAFLNYRFHGHIFRCTEKY